MGTVLNSIFGYKKFAEDSAPSTASSGTSSTDATAEAQARVRQAAGTGRVQLLAGAETGIKKTVGG